mgnify:CR=1 FL=1
MIHVENITKSFDETEVLRGISAIFKKGKTNLIIGQSGSGKTVFLKSLLGLFDTDTGSIKFEKKVLNDMTDKERAILRQEMGMVFQGSALFDSMSVEENIMFPMQMFTKEIDSVIRDKANIAIKRVNLINANHKLTDEISGGMKKRVAIARALATNPKIVLLDEPTSSLDLSVQAQILNLLNDLKKELGLSYLFISHDLAVVKYMSDRVMVMENGSLLELQEADALYGTPKHPYTQKLIDAIP